MNHRFTYKDTKSNPTSLWSSRYWQLDLFGWGTWDKSWDKSWDRVWGSVCGCSACDDLLLQLTHALHPYVQMYWPLNAIYYSYNCIKSCTICTLCTWDVSHVLLAYAFATFHPIVKGLQCDTNAILSGRNSTCISTTLELPSSFAELHKYNHMWVVSLELSRFS